MKALIMWDGVCLFLMLVLLAPSRPKALPVWGVFAAWSLVTLQIYKHSHHVAIGSAVAGFLMILASNRRHSRPSPT
jgi:hypothetical protein